MTIGWTAPTRINPATIGNWIKTAPRPAAIGPEAWARCVPIKIKDEIAAYSFDQLLLTGRYALTETGSDYKGFDKLFLLFEPTGTEKALWALDCLERAEDTGPVPAEEFPSFSADMRRILAPDSLGQIPSTWGSIISHDLNNCITDAVCRTGIALEQNPGSVDMILFADLLNSISESLFKARRGMLSMGHFIKAASSDQLFLNRAFEKASVMFPERISEGIGSKIRDIKTYLSLYRDYSPEEAMVISPNSDASPGVFQKPADMLLLRNDPRSLLRSMLDRAATRRGMGGGEVRDNNWKNFLGMINNRAGGTEIIQETLASMRGSGHTMEGIVKSAVSE